MTLTHLFLHWDQPLHGAMRVVSRFCQKFFDCICQEHCIKDCFHHAWSPFDCNETSKNLEKAEAYLHRTGLLSFESASMLFFCLVHYQDFLILKELGIWEVSKMYSHWVFIACASNVVCSFISLTRFAGLRERPGCHPWMGSRLQSLTL